MKSFIIRGTITNKEQLKNSNVGGLRERLTIRLEHTGEEVEEVTATNSGAGYCLSCSMSYLENKILELEAHITKKGSIIITRILKDYYKD